MTYSTHGVAYNTIMNALHDNKLDIVENVINQQDKEFNYFLSKNINENITAFKKCVGADINTPTNINKQCAIFKHLSFEQCLQLMKYHINAQLPHIQVLLENSDYCKDKLLESWGYRHALSYHFKQEDFNAINQLNDLLEKNVLSETYKFGYFHGDYQFIDNKKSLMPRLLYIEDNTYTPAYNIIYDYSNAKKDYLLSQGIELPSIEQARQITEKIIASLEDAGSYDDYDEAYLITGFKNYKTIILYNELQDNLPTNNKKVSKAKI